MRDGSILAGTPPPFNVLPFCVYVYLQLYWYIFDAVSTCPCCVSLWALSS